MSKKGWKGSPVEYQAFKNNPQWSREKAKSKRSKVSERCSKKS